MPFLLGLTGNIACGKSTVGRFLVDNYAVEYLDADVLVHALYAPHTPETAAIASRFGAHLLTPDGVIDRARLGDHVMAHPDERAALEAILHPGIRRDLDARITASTAAVLVIDAIRLFESGVADRCDTVWVVVCDYATQIERLVRSRGLTREQAILRIEAQSPQEEKARRGNVVIANRGSVGDFAEQVASAWQASVAPRLHPPTRED